MQFLNLILLLNLFFSLIRSNQDENKSLSELKDNLLSKLMSGEIDISNLDI